MSDRELRRLTEAINEQNAILRANVQALLSAQDQILKLVAVQNGENPGDAVYHLKDPEERVDRDVEYQRDLMDDQPTGGLDPWPIHILMELDNGRHVGSSTDRKPYHLIDHPSGDLHDRAITVVESTFPDFTGEVELFAHEDGTISIEADSVTPDRGGGE